MRDNRARSLIFRISAAFLAMILPLCGAGTAKCEGTEASFDVPEGMTTRASGTLLSAEAVVLNGKTGNVKSLCTFSNAKGRLLISITEKTGYETVRTGDGALFSAWKITSGTGSICALIRLGTTHLAAVTVMARQSSWAASRPDEEKILWINSYRAASPAVVPASTQRHMTEHGETVAFETGVPGATVELWLRDGEAVTTATADETGHVIFDAKHAADGKDHYVSATYTFGSYDYHAATAYASDPVNLMPAGGGTGYEWVTNNDCATYVSRILTAGGFPIYAPYTNSSSSPGGSVRHTLVSLTGSEYFKSTFTIEDFHEGDIAWGHNMGHTMYCSEVNREEGTIHVYAHSTRPNDPLSDNGWVSIADLNAVMRMVIEEIYDYEYRIDGLIGEADLVLPASVSRIEASAFEGSAAESAYLPDGCAMIGAGAFRDCLNLRWVRIPQNCDIDETAFDGCRGVMIYGAPDSPAEQFCQDHEGFLFKPEI